MTAEQFCLRWNNHQSTLVSVFDGLFESGTLVDCTLAADGQYLKAHKVVLSACSPYLESCYKTFKNLSSQKSFKEVILSQPTVKAFPSNQLHSRGLLTISLGLLYFQQI